MSIKILDLTYCEALTENKIGVNGGRSLAIGFRLQHLGLFWLYPTKPIDRSDLDDFEQTEID